MICFSLTDAKQNLVVRIFSYLRAGERKRKSSIKRDVLSELICLVVHQLPREKVDS